MLIIRKLTEEAYCIMQLNMVIHRIFHAQKNRIRPEMYKIGLSPGQPKVLSHVYAHNRCMQKEIAEALDIEPATVSKILDNMVEAGLVERAPMAERKRAESVTITQKGREYYDRWTDICAQYETVALEGFTEAEREQLFAYLHRLYRNVTGKEME